MGPKTKEMVPNGDDGDQQVPLWRRPFHWFHSRLLFGYFTPYMKKAQTEGAGSVRPEKLPDLWKHDDVAIWSRRFIHAARRQWERPDGPSKYALIVTLIRVFWLPFFCVLAVSVFEVQLNVASIMFMRRFLEWQEMGVDSYTYAAITKGILYKTNEDLLLLHLGSSSSVLLHVFTHYPKSMSSRLLMALIHSGFLFGLATLCTELVRVFVKSQLIFGKERVALRVEGALSTALFRRVLMPSNKKERRQKSSSGDEQKFGKPDAETSAYNVLMVCLIRSNRSLRIYSRRNSYVTKNRCVRCVVFIE